MLSNAFVKSVVTDVQWYTPLSTPLLQHSVYHQVILASVVGPNPAWSGGCTLCSSGASRAYSTVANSLYNIGRPQIGL